MIELEAESKINGIIPSSIKGAIVEVIKRNPISRIEHSSVFAVIFKHEKENSLKMVEAAKKLSIEEPDILFSGSEVDEKFNMENSAVFITATIN